jgi:hypothetical protein
MASSKSGEISKKLKNLNKPEKSSSRSYSITEDGVTRSATPEEAEEFDRQRMVGLFKKDEPSIAKRLQDTLTGKLKDVGYDPEGVDTLEKVGDVFTVNDPQDLSKALPIGRVKDKTTKIRKLVFPGEGKTAAMAYKDKVQNLNKLFKAKDAPKFREAVTDANKFLKDQMQAIAKSPELDPIKKKEAISKLYDQQKRNVHLMNVLDKSVYTK